MTPRRPTNEGDGEAGRPQWCSVTKAWGHVDHVLFDDDEDEEDDDECFESDVDDNDAGDGYTNDDSKQEQDRGNGNANGERGSGRGLGSSRSSVSSIQSLFLDELDPREVYLLGCKAVDIMPSSRMLGQLASAKALTVLDMEYVTMENQVGDGGKGMGMKFLETHSLPLGLSSLSLFQYTCIASQSPRRAPSRLPTASWLSRASRRSSCEGRG